MEINVRGDIESYLKLEGVRDVLEWKRDDTLDINGWDLKKALQLLHRSNPTVIEWCTSLIVYLEREEFLALKKLLPQYFSVKKSLYHYCHMTETNYREYLKGDMVRVKKYFYVLRPLLAEKWIIDRRTNPPMLFDELIEAELEEELRPELERLLDMKKSMPEMGRAPKIKIFNDYIESVLPEIRTIAGAEEEKKVEWETLNER